MFTEFKLAAALIGGALTIAALLGLWGWIHHSGYIAGQAEREKHYAPLLQAARDAKDKADARAATAERNAGAINAQSEKDHAQFIKTLDAREHYANSRIADILREHTARNAAASRCQVSGLAGAADQPTGGTASIGYDDGVSERITRASGRLAADGGRCEHDAAEVAEFQSWYAQQRANAREAMK